MTRSDMIAGWSNPRLRSEVWSMLSARRQASEPERQYMVDLEVEPALALWHYQLWARNNGCGPARGVAAAIDFPGAIAFSRAETAAQSSVGTSVLRRPEDRHSRLEIGPAALPRIAPEEQLHIEVWYVALYQENPQQPVVCLLSDDGLARRSQPPKALRPWLLPEQTWRHIAAYLVTTFMYMLVLWPRFLAYAMYVLHHRPVMERLDASH